MKGGVLCRAAGFALFLTFFVAGLVSCEKSDSRQGRIRLRFLDGDFTVVRSDGAEVPDSNDFILDITASDGSLVYHGAYGACPEEIYAPAGSYVVSVRSEEFSVPKFSAPQYGDDQCIIVPAGGVVDVALNCRMLNCGMMLKVSSDFPTVYPSGTFCLRADEGELDYGYSEQRIAYFLPGNISVVLQDEATAEEDVLMTRNLAAKEVLTISISIASGSSGGISMQIDTTKTWLDENYVLGGEEERGTDISNAMSVSEAKENVGRSGVWVYGYIVGGDLKASASGISFSPPFSSATNLAIAAKSSVTDKSSCMSVQLPSGTVRDALNLVDHPDLLGVQVYLKGDISEAYFGIVGLRNVKDYAFK